MYSVYPAQIQSSCNGSLELFTGIFYLARILGAGQGSIRPSLSPNGNIYLEQDILTSPNNQGDEYENLWYFQESSIPTFYGWGSGSQSNAKVVGDDMSPLLILRNVTDISQDIYDDATSTFWEFEPFAFERDGITNTGYKMRLGQPSQSEFGPSVTFSTSPKSPKGWYLQYSYEMDKSPNPLDTSPERFVADSLLLFQPQNFKLYAEIAHMDAGNLHELETSERVKQYLEPTFLQNPTPNDVTSNVTVGTEVAYDLYVQPDPQDDLFAGITVISKDTTPSRKYFDLETSSCKQSRIIVLQATRALEGTEEVDVERFSAKNVPAYVTYLKEFKGVRYFCWADVSAVADMMGRNGIVRNVLVRDLALLKHLIRARGYTGEFHEIPQNVNDAAKIRIKVQGTVRGSLPIPFVQFEESNSIFVSKYEEEYLRNLSSTTTTTSTTEKYSTVKN